MKTILYVVIYVVLAIAALLIGIAVIKSITRRNVKANTFAKTIDRVLPIRLSHPTTKGEALELSKDLAHKGNVEALEKYAEDEAAKITADVVK